MLDVLFAKCEMLYKALVVFPIQALYMNAPGVGGVGGWGGLSEVQVCARLTGQTELFWGDHLYECSQFVFIRLNSIIITVKALVYFYFLFQFLHCTASIVLKGVGEKLCFSVLKATHCVSEIHPTYYIIAGKEGGPLNI